MHVAIGGHVAIFHDWLGEKGVALNLKRASFDFQDQG